MPAWLTTAPSADPLITTALLLVPALVPTIDRAPPVTLVDSIRVSNRLTPILPLPVPAPVPVMPSVPVPLTRTVDAYIDTPELKLVAPAAAPPPMMAMLPLP